MQTYRRVLAIIFLGGLAASIVNAARPGSLPWYRDPSTDIRNEDTRKQFLVTMDEVRRHLMDYSAVFIDARRPDQFAAGHLRGAFSLPSTEMDKAPMPGEVAYLSHLYMSVAPNQLAIIYCDGGKCEASEAVFEHLKAGGFTNMRIFKEGWEMIEPSDLPKETGPMQVNTMDPGAAPMEQGAPPSDPTQTMPGEGAPTSAS